MNGCVGLADGLAGQAFHDCLHDTVLVSKAKGNLPPAGGMEVAIVKVFVNKRRGETARLDGSSRAGIRRCSEVWVARRA